MRAKILILLLFFAPVALADEDPLPLALMAQYARAVARIEVLEKSLGACLTWSYTRRDLI